MEYVAYGNIEMKNGLMSTLENVCALHKLFSLLLFLDRWKITCYVNIAKEASIYRRLRPHKRHLQMLGHSNI